MNEWINNVVHIYSGILLRHKRKEVGSFVVMWMNLESVIQNEVGQKEKQISYFNAYTMAPRKMVLMNLFAGRV